MHLSWPDIRSLPLTQSTKQPSTRSVGFGIPGGSVFAIILLCLASALAARGQSGASGVAAANLGAGTGSSASTDSASERPVGIAENNACDIPSSKHKGDLGPIIGSADKHSNGGVENHSRRNTVEGDYLVIDYNASSHGIDWFDYHHFWDPKQRDEDRNVILRNGSFLPIVYTREKIAVHVCNLHFDDQLTVTTSPIALPEGGADIRSNTQASQPAALSSLSSTLDALQTAAPTGVTAAQSGVGFSSTPAAITLSTVTGVTPTTMSGAPGTPTYSNATITISGRQFAEMLYSFVASADSLLHDVQQMRAQGRTQALPGSIPSINEQLQKIEFKLDHDVSTLRPFFTTGERPPLPQDAANAAADFPAFDEDVTLVQNLSAQMGTLASALTAQGFGGRAVTLQTDFETLSGVLDFIDLGLNYRNCTNPPQAPAAAPMPPAAQAPSLTPTQIGQIPPSEFAALPEATLKSLSAQQVQGITAAQLAALATKYPSKLDALMAPKPPAPAPAPGADQPPCSAFELTKYEQFYDSYARELARLTHNDPDTFEPRHFELEARKLRSRMFDELGGMKRDLYEIDERAGKVFDQMNQWYHLSSVEQTDLLTPASNNALLRVSILVQRGFTPFVLANNPAATTPTVPAVASSASALSASTNTPAHAVKTILIEVHRLANFNLAGGVMMIHVPTTSYVLGPTQNAIPVTTTSNGTSSTTNSGICPVPMTAAPPPTSSLSPTPGNAATYACIVQTERTNWQVVGMAGIAWYPFGRDYFPRRLGWTNPPRNYIPSALIGTSVTSLGTVFGGLNFEPISGVDFFGGVATADQQALPNGVSTTTLVPASYTLTEQTELHHSYAFGIAFDLGVISQLFAKPSVPPSSGSLP